MPVWSEAPKVIFSSPLRTLRAGGAGDVDVVFDEIAVPADTRSTCHIGVG